MWDEDGEADNEKLAEKAQMAGVKSLQPRLISSFLGNNSIRSTQPLIHLFRFDLGSSFFSLSTSSATATASFIDDEC